jgi:hypothetical protein
LLKSSQISSAKKNFAPAQLSYFFKICNSGLTNQTYKINFSSGMQMGMRPMAPGGSVTMGMRPQGGMPQGRPTMGIDMGVPPAKKARPEDILIPEEDFLRTEPTRVVFQISVPKVEKDDWKCRGQLISVTMPLTTTFTEVKLKIEEETGMPPQKQKLQVEGAFVKGIIRLWNKNYYFFN